jgi:transcriptional regulator with XRE-family HTH domain
MKKKEDLALPHHISLSRVLRDARQNRGLSVAEVADKVGVSSAAIYYWESDRVRPRADNLKAICKVLRLPIRATLAAYAR